MGSYVKVYQNTALGPTDAIDTGQVGTSHLDEMVIAITNGNTSQTRTVGIFIRDENGVQLYQISPAAIAATGTAFYVFGKGATSTGITAGYAIPPAARVQVTAGAPASGSGVGRVTIYGRRSS